MKLLLTSAGLSNESIRTALAELMGKSIGDGKLVFVPTAMHAVAEGGKYLWEDIARQSELGWGSASMLRPHLNASYFEHVSMADMERVCGDVDAPRCLRKNRTLQGDFASERIRPKAATMGPCSR